MNHDVGFLLIFAALAAAIPLGCRLFAARGSSRWLAGILALAMGTMARMHATTDQMAASSRLHYTIMMLAHFAILSLGFKLWFSLDYPRFGHSARVVAHPTAHSSLGFLIIADYSLKAPHPILELRLGQARAPRP